MKLTSLPNWQLTTTIISSIRAGLSLGQCQVLGGVIQEVPNAVQEEQIIRLFVPLKIPAMTAHAYSAALSTDLPQTDDLITTAQVLQWLNEIMGKTGVNISPIMLDLPFIYQQLTRFADRIEIKTMLAEFHELLEGIKRAELRISIHTLLGVPKETTLKSHQEVLSRTRECLARMVEQAKLLVMQSNTIESAMRMEAYFTWVALAQARCGAELGYLDNAYQEISQNVAFWKQQSQRIAHDLLLGTHPERFLFSDFVTDIPITTLIEWLDFAHQEKKGVLWLDELRRRTPSWYANTQKERITSKERGQLRQDKKIVIPTMQKLIAKERIMRGYVAQYQFFREQNVMITPLQKEIEQVSKGDFVILEPVSS